MDFKVINGIRSLGIDMINASGGGHPGITLSAAPTIYTLFAYHLNFNPSSSTWINRDRFVLSAGHASALLYSTLLYCGYDIKLDDLRNFRHINSPFGGHPTLNQKLGIELSSGALGEGFATAVGMAMGEEYLKGLLGKDLINHYTYVFVSDGDLMEGISYEAASLAGSQKLSNLIVLYDSNNVTKDGKTKGVFEEDVLKRFESMGWHTELVTSGEDISLIDKAITKAKSVTDKPSIIEIKSILGIGTSLAGTNKVHSGTLSEKDTELVKEKMNIKEVPFHVSKEAVTIMRDKIEKRITPIYNEWVTKYNSIIEKDEKKKELLETLENNSLKLLVKNIQINFDDEMEEDLRITNKKLMNLIANLTPLFIGGSADVVTSTNTYIDNGRDFSPEYRKGVNIHFGVRELSMGAILNGLALMGLTPFGSTFLAFSDYMKPSLRLSAMMNLGVTYIFTHDSVKIGYDGETHEPIEQLGMLRSIPNMHVFRPADVNELVGSWDYIINKKVPSSLIIPKERKRKLPNSRVDMVSKGAYIIKESIGRMSGIIISSGSEVETALWISNELDKRGLYTRVISFPSLELYESTKEEYKKELFPVGVRVIAIEASNDKVWNEFVYNKKYILNINEYGKSGSEEEILKYLNFDEYSLLEKTEKLLK